MTDEEADRLDEYYTARTPPVGANRMRGNSDRAFRMVAVDELTAEYLMLKTRNTDKTPAQVLGDMVRREMASASLREYSVQTGIDTSIETGREACLTP
jgi:hypothetical protein